MATALHTRYLLTDDLISQHADAEKQLTALEEATELDLGATARVLDGCLEVRFHGPGAAIADFVEACDAGAIYITRVSPDSAAEYELFQSRISGLTEVEHFYSGRP